MVSRLFTVLFVFLAVAKCSAQQEDKKQIFNWPATVVAVSGQNDDLVSTVRLLNKGGCHESNPLVGRQPTTDKLLMTKAIGVGVTIGGMVALNALANRKGVSSRDRKIVRRISQGFGYV